MEHVNTDSVARQIVFLLNKKFPPVKSREKEHKQQLIQCIESTGYIRAEPEIQPDINQEAMDYFENFRQNSESEFDSESEQIFLQQEQERLPSLAEREQSSISQPFSRTFIQGASARTAEIQERAMTYDEQDFIETREKISTVLNKIATKRPDIPFEQLLAMSMNMYLEIKKIYNFTNDFSGEMKGQVKRGYTVLVLYYTLIQFKICLPKEELVVLFDTPLSDLAKADKNIKIAFRDRPEYNLDINYLCNMRSMLTNDQISLIEELIKSLQAKGIFSIPATPPEIAATIYHVTKIALKTIQLYSGITADTIRKNTYKIPK